MAEVFVEQSLASPRSAKNWYNTERETDKNIKSKIKYSTMDAINIATDNLENIYFVGNNIYIHIFFVLHNRVIKIQSWRTSKQCSNQMYFLSNLLCVKVYNYWN